MKKTFSIENLECAHCAQKMEDGIKKLNGVNSASVNFFAQKLILDADDERFDRILKDVIKLCRKIEPDCEIMVK